MISLLRLSAIIELCDAVEEFCTRLRKDAAKATERRSRDTPARSPMTDGILTNHPKSRSKLPSALSLCVNRTSTGCADQAVLAEAMDPLVAEVNKILAASDSHTELLLTDEIMLARLGPDAFDRSPMNKRKAQRKRSDRRKKFIDELATLPYPVSVYEYALGGTRNGRFACLSSARLNEKASLQVERPNSRGCGSAHPRHPFLCALASLDSRRWIRRTGEASGSETSDDTPQARLLFRLGDQLPRFESRYE